MSINDRIREIMAHFGLKKSEFAKIIDVNYTTVDSVVNPKSNNKPSFDTLYALMAQYRDVNPDWLIFGEGEMFRKMENEITDYGNLQKSELDKINEDTPQYTPEKKGKEAIKGIDEIELMKKSIELLQLEMFKLKQEVAELKKK